MGNPHVFFRVKNMDNQDPFALNIAGVDNLISNGVNKHSTPGNDDGDIGEEIDILELPMSDEELIKLRDEWEQVSGEYLPKIKTRQDKNKLYYLGLQKTGGENGNTPVSTNLIFEAEETFIPQALSRNPEPVVWSDNTDLGKSASNDLKTMLQFHADILCLRRKLGVMVRHWSIYFIGVIKHGWDEKTNDIKSEIRKPQNFILDPDGYIDEYGNFCGKFLGERIDCTASDLIDMFPKSTEYITAKVNGKLGTSTFRTEWWTDDYCFTTFQDEVLDKHKNEFFNYGDGKPNHFAIPKMPYTFLSVFSMQEHPYDETNLIEQNISNQDRITERDDQITKNLKSANNSVVLSGISFTSETASQARDTFYEEGFLLVPDGQVESAVKRLPANDLPSAIFTSQDNDKNSLRSIFGTNGLAPNNEPDVAVRNNILAQNHDSSRIGGGIGDALEQVADNIFNWWTQLYYVFYDEPHFGAVMGNGRAVEYVSLIMSGEERKFVVSVSPNSMAPKDEVSEQNMAIELYQQKAIDPITLFKKLNYPDPMETAKQVALWATNPQLYMQMYFPEQAQAPDSPNPQVGQKPPPQEGTPTPSLANPESSASLSQVPITNLGIPQ